MAGIPETKVAITGSATGCYARKKQFSIAVGIYKF